jgi:hypothetical protein
MGLHGLAAAQPLLRCEVTYAGATQVLQTGVVASAYEVAAVDIAGRFAFKPVMVGQGDRVAYIKLYVYRATDGDPVLVQQGKYLPPWPAGAAQSLTGAQFIYAGPLQRELQYACRLEGVQP